MDFNNDCFNLCIGPVVAIVETGRVETVSPISQMGQQANRTVRPNAKMVFNKISYRLIQGNRRITEMIAAAETGNIKLFVGPQRMDIKESGQFSQIEKHEKKTILKSVRSRPESPVSDGSFINAAMHGSLRSMQVK